MKEGKAKVMSIDSSQLPDGTDTDGLLSIHHALEHAIGWRNHATLASLHVKQLLESEMKSRDNEAIMSQISEAEKEELNKSIEGLQATITLLDEMTEKAQSCYAAFFNTHNQHVISNYLASAQQALKQPNKEVSDEHHKEV